MSAQPVAGNTPPPAPTPLPQVVIDEGRFEGKEVGQTLLTLAGTAKLVPVATDDSHRVLTMDDIVTVQVDVKITGLGFEVDSNGILRRIQKARPIEGTAQIVDVVRSRDTRVR